MRKQSRKRRGVVLLVVLTLLVLLTLLAVTFAIVAGQYKTAAQASSKIERNAGPDLLDLGLNTLVRDTSDTDSVLRGHSLLLDLYGLDGFTGELTAVSSSSSTISTGTGNQFFELQFDTATLKGSDGSSYSLNSTPGFYNGCVLTPVNGDASGASMRIISYTSASVFRVMADRTDARSNRPKVGDRVVVNGRPFNGAGFGYETNSSAGRYTKLNSSAIRPNRKGEVTTQFANFVAGGADESYDAVDFQNMALAALVPDRTSLISRNNLAYVVPSFHRPAMINYWVARAAAQTPAPPAPDPRQQYWRDRRNSTIFRPMAWDHPNFTGGNLELTFGLDGEPGVAGFDDDGNGTIDRDATGTPDPLEVGYFNSDDVTPLVNGPWDVDNDNDGVNDSIWLDINAPLQQMPDGRLVKPLYAILCVDLDGRVNLNAHGNLTHINQTPSPIIDAGNLARGQQANSLREGQGYGPAEVYLGGILGNSLVTSPNRNAYERLLRGDVQRQIRGRYGDNQLPGVDGLDLMAEVKFFEFPEKFFNYSAYQTSFHSPSDLFGELAFGLDHRGQLQYDRPQRANALEDSPYEINLVDPSARGDRPYSLEELERLLRYNDADTDSLADRLTTLVGEFDRSSLAENNRRLVTTDSFSLPVPPILARDLEAFKELYITGTYASAFPKDRPLHITDLLALRLAQNGLTGTTLSSELEKMLAWELADGVRFDINRPFGNGRDSNNNRVVDEHGPQPGQQLEATAGVDQIWSQNVDHDNDGNTTASDTDAYLARQLFARHLYVLAMMVRSSDIDFNGDGSKSTAETAKGLAQWAINVVDFRDADSIMTPFEYDPTPFDGWSVDGNVATNDWADGVDNDGDGNTDEADEQPLVWGCERPELLITETLAFHDERTEPDAGSDGSNDQRLQPRGSFFVELYNPWANDERLPAEFYFDHASGNWQNGVMLNKQSPSGSDPVWRITVENGGTIERTVYMTSSPGTIQGRTYSTTLPVGLLGPGKYAVIGSVGQEQKPVGMGSGTIDLDMDGTDDKLTTIGRLVAATEGGSLDYANTRSIVLEPSTDTTVQQVTILNNGAVEPNLTQIQPAIAVAVNKVWDPGTMTTIDESLNISQPRLSFPAYPLTGPGGELWDADLADYEGAYTPPIAAPLPRDIPTSAVVHLQRLANPLLPFDAVSNPYLTIDKMPVEVDEFNGIDSMLDTLGASVDSFERGESDASAATNRTLWSVDPTASRSGGASIAETNGPHELPFQLKHSLGYLSKNYAPNATNRFAQGDVVGSGPIPNQYVGAPKSDPSGNPFPWLTWNNRPFVSQYEMMLVPVNSPDELTSNFSLNTGANPYQGAAQFKHLLNFFIATEGRGTSTVNYPDMYRLFEFTGVSSRFVGTETWLNPSVFASGYGTDYLHPPFNRISRFRDPGKININTVFDDRIWDAIRGKNGTSLGATFDEWIDSRRGYGAAGSGIVTANASFPTLFANPLRSTDSGQLAPVDSMERVGVECGLLRSGMIGASSSPYDIRSTDDDPMFGDDSGGTHIDPDRNPYFRYQSLMRMGNLVTTQSNVYATWITVGFFEVNPATATLGREYGVETGNVKRHRGFYVVDRSIPVAFEPGQNHNIQQAIRLRRIIE
jgi:hypothetical protein